MNGNNVFLKKEEMSLFLNARQHELTKFSFLAPILGPYEVNRLISALITGPLWLM